MSEALLIVQCLQGLAAAGLSLATYLPPISDLLRVRHAAGESITQEDLEQLFDEGDALQAAVLTKLRAAANAEAASRGDAQA